MIAPKTIAIDFDGVIHGYESGWTGVIPIDPPVPGARAGIAALRAQGFRVVVFSCRALTHEGRAGIRAWLEHHHMPVDDGSGRPFMIDEITSIKPHAVLYVDDRAHRFTGCWEEVALLAKNVPRPWNTLTQKASDDPRCAVCNVAVYEVTPRGTYAECGHQIPGGDQVR